MFRQVVFGRGPFLVLAVCLLAGPPVHAQSEPTLSLREAISRTLDGSPQLAVLPLRERARSARIDGAALRPAPTVSLELENVFGTGEKRGLSELEATFAISQVVELGDQRGRRVALARQGSDALAIEREIIQLDLMAEVARRYVHVAVDEKELELAGLAYELAERTLREVERRVGSARAPAADLHRARAALMRAEIDQEHAEHELLAARRRLAAMWGSTVVDFGGLNADLLRLPELGDLDAFVEDMARSPDLLQYVSRARRHEAEAALAQAQARSSIALSAGVRRYQGSSDTAFVAGVSVPLFATRRARPLVAEAEALQAEAEAEGRAARIDAEAVLFGMTQELQHAVTEATLLRDRVRPEIKAALQATERAWRAGRSSYLEWTDAQRERIDVEISLIQAAANAHLFRTEIERLTGASAASSAGAASFNASQGASR